MTSPSPDRTEQIVVLEKKLLAAFGDRNIAVLDELIHEDALFVLPNAQTIDKATVLDNYRNGTMVMNITPSDHKINILEDAAVISVNLELHGKSYDNEIHAQFRYLRVWKLFNDSWKIIATGGIPITV